MRQLAARAGLTVPEPEDAKQDAESKRDRESLLKAHEIAAAWFREQLAEHQRARRRGASCRTRGVTPETIELLGIGYAPATREASSAG